MKSKQRVSELRALTDDQLNDEVLKLKKEQFNLRFQRATGQLAGTAELGKARRAVARVLTMTVEKTREEGR